MDQKRKADHTIIGVHITDRLRHAVDVQQVLTRHGAIIKTRLGLHEVGEGRSSPEGVLLLETVGGKRDIQALVRDLSKIEGLEIQKMVFTH